MKKKKLNKKLTLNKKNVSVLNDLEMGYHKGGITGGNCISIDLRCPEDYTIVICSDFCGGGGGVPISDLC